MKRHPARTRSLMALLAGSASGLLLAQTAAPEGAAKDTPAAAATHSTATHPTATLSTVTVTDTANDVYNEVSASIGQAVFTTTAPSVT